VQRKAMKNSPGIRLDMVHESMPFYRETAWRQS
jgi:hypothetical protein